MIALDTNVLVRFLVRDDEDQTGRARRLLERVVDEEGACWITDVVLCDVVWVLTSCYRLSRAEVADALALLLRAKHTEFRCSDAIARALDAFVEGRGDFADYVIREAALEAGCDAIATFDEVLLDEASFVPV